MKKYCEKCEKEIDDQEAKFCPACGTPLNEKTQDNDRVSAEDDEIKAELDRIQEQSLKSIVFTEIAEPVMQKISEILNIGILRILLILAYLFLGLGINKIAVVGLTMVAYNGIFSKETMLTIFMISILISLVRCPAVFFKHILNKKAKQEIEQGNTGICKENPLNIIGSIASVVCFGIGVIAFIIGIISGIYEYGVDSLVLLNLTGSCFWLGAVQFFGGVEEAFKTIEELSQDDMQNETETTK